MAGADLFSFVGSTLDDNYRVDAVIGEGGFGVVYKGWHLVFEEPVAIKCLKVPPHFTAEARQTFEQRFRDEGKLLRKLGEKHRSVVRAHDVRILRGASQSVPYLVLEWLDGATLDEVLRRRLASGQGPFREEEAIALLSPAIEALAVAHSGQIEQVVAHRDIKPENLFVLQDGSVKVLDFGIAKAMQDGEQMTAQQSRTSSGFSAFSPPYGAPEQFSSKKHGESGPWTDVHALGLILAELVSGRRPYGEGEYADLLLEAIAADRPTPRKLGAKVSDAFEAVCSRALALRPQDRFPNAAELMAALQPGQPHVARTVASSPLTTPASPLVAQVMTVPTFVPDTPSQTGPREPPTRKPDPTPATPHTVVPDPDPAPEPVPLLPPPPGSNTHRGRQRNPWIPAVTVGVLVMLGVGGLFWASRLTSTIEG